MANEPLEVEQPLLQSSSEIDKLVFDLYQIFPRHQNYCDGDKLSFSRMLLSDREYQLTEPWSATIVDEVVKEVQKMQYIGSLEAAEKHISAKIFKENLHTSVKILQICMDLQDSVQRSLQNTADKILQICTDSQRSKTWKVSPNRCILVKDLSCRRKRKFVCRNSLGWTMNVYFFFSESTLLGILSLHSKR